MDENLLEKYRAWNERLEILMQKYKARKYKAQKLETYYNVKKEYNTDYEG
jgi:hypothetical protein